MSKSLKGRDLITTQEWNIEELDRTLELAVELISHIGCLKDDLRIEL